MTATWRANTNGGSSAGASASMTMPSGSVSGDQIIVVLYKENTNAVTPPSGFTEKQAVTSSGSSFRQYIFHGERSVVGAGPYSFSWTGSVYREWAVLAYSGVATGDPWDPATLGTANPAGGANTTVTAPSVTTTVDDTLLLSMATSFNDTSSPWTHPSGMTERFDVSEINVAELVLASAGASGTKQHTSSSASTLTAIIGALKAVGGGGPATLTGTASPSITLTLGPNLARQPAQATPSVTLSLAPNASATLQAQATPSITLSLSASGLKIALATASPSITLSLAPNASASLGATATPSITLSLAPAAFKVGLAQAAPSITLSLAPVGLWVARAQATPSITLTLAPSSGGQVGSATPSITLSLAPVALVTALTTAPPSITLTLGPVGLGIGIATATPSILLSLAPSALAVNAATAAPSITLTLTPVVPGVAPIEATAAIAITLALAAIAQRVSTATLYTTYNRGNEQGVREVAIGYRGSR